jgi:hypothetical protein
MRKIVVALALLGIGVVSASGSQQMAIWDFGSNAANYTTAPAAENLVGTPTLVLSGGTLDPDGKDGWAYTDAAGVFHSVGQSAAWDDVKVSSSPDAKWIVTLDTTGWADISVRFDYKAWDSKTTSFDLSYQINNSGTWVSILDNQTIIADKAFHSFSYSMASIDAIENCSSVQLKVSDLDRVGNNEFAFDNYELTGTPIPEPATIALFGLGIPAILRKRAK